MLVSNGQESDGMKYHIYDENHDKMRIVSSLWEAKHITSIRQGWTFERVKQPRPIYEDAPF
jgi:hypothetical protein